MKIATYNVNGIRSAIKKGLPAWLETEQPDIVCLQEIKATPDDVPLNLLEHLGYKYFWHPAIKKGYSGVAILSKIDPKAVHVGCGIEKYDSEGRVLRLDFEDFSVMNVYMPSGTTGEERQAFKYCWLDDFFQYGHGVRGTVPELIICGDYNIAHKNHDIHSPKTNQKTSGFLPEERAWLDKFTEAGFVDAFRHVEPEKVEYSWWSQRFNSRAQNKGWRIDYHMVTPGLAKRLTSARHANEAVHSDHCPVIITFN